MSKARQVFVPRPAENDEREPIPQLNQLVTNPSDRLKISRKVARVQELKELLDPLEDEREKLKDELKELLGQYQVGKCLVDDIRVNYFGFPRNTLKKELLLENGVAAETITKSTVTTMAYTLKVERLKD